MNSREEKLIPLPTGEGALQEMGGGFVGYGNTETLKKREKYFWYPSPGPLTRATLSRRERELRKNITPTPLGRTNLRLETQVGYLARIVCTTSDELA